MRKEKGITLIALVVTIVVLIILAAVSISMLTGENGIIKKASEAKDATTRGEEQEFVDLANTAAIQNSYITRGNGVFTQEELETELDKVSGNRETIVKPNGYKYLITFVESENEFEIDRPVEDLTSEDWENIIEEAEKDDEIQGIGTDGSPVDMSLWRYTEIEGGVGLFGGTESECSWSEVGYLGECPNGEIIGFVPQYIKVNGEFQPVISMSTTFKGNNELIYLPEIPSTVTNIDSICHNCENLKTIIIPSTVGNIGRYAFFNCDSLENITIANGIKDIEERAFGESNKITEIKLPSTLENIGEDAFSYCTSLSKIDLPEGLKTLYESFIGCSSLTSIEIPSTLEEILSDEYYSYISPFDECHSLKDVKFREGTQKITSRLFYGTQIETIEIPNGVKEIATSAFTNCYNLTSITIPNSVTSIGWEAFDGCNNLTTVNYKGTEEQWNQISITGTGNEELVNATINYNYTGE